MREQKRGTVQGLLAPMKGVLAMWENMMGDELGRMERTENSR